MQDESSLLLTEGAFRPHPLIENCLQQAVSVCKHLSKQKILNEETLTGALLGALTTTLAREAQSGSNPVQIRWIPFNKGRAANRDSEAANGADLALAILGEDGKARLAFFQAKRGKVTMKESEDGLVKSWSIDVRHDTPDTHAPMNTQMQTLVIRGWALLGLNSPQSAPKIRREIEELTWIHYLAYGPGDPLCLPLSEMDEAYSRELRHDSYRNLVTFDPNGASTRSFYDVLLAGLTEDCKEWLTVPEVAFFDSLPSWLDLAPVAILCSPQAWTRAPAKWQKNSLDFSDLKLSTRNSTPPEAAAIATNPWKSPE
jgi:hypothetical protein